MPTPRPLPSNPQESEPDVFIIESLRISDEINQRFEGEALSKCLRIAGLKPIYQYVKNAEEFSDAIKSFNYSNYRFLHVSVHGSIDSIETTHEIISNIELANMLSNKLNLRRIFFSSCHVGSSTLLDLLCVKNPNLHSFSAPSNTIPFDIALAFWTSFYIKQFHQRRMNLGITSMIRNLTTLCNFFEVRISLRYFNSKTKKHLPRTLPPD
nr:hypothetical protein [Armatimonas sp.]